MDLKNGLAVTVEDRKRMKSAKSWRIFLTIDEANSKALASVFSGMIEAKVAVRLAVGESIVAIDPAFIEDVVTKKGSYQLVIETMYEYQAKEIAMDLTMMVGDKGRLFIGKCCETAAPAQGTTKAEKSPFEGASKGLSKIGPEKIKALHSTFFRNERFWEYVSEQHRTTKGLLTAVEVTSKDECKDLFKSLAGVESCSDLEEMYVNSFVRGFNEWLNS